jgi:hypothetical protein
MKLKEFRNRQSTGLSTVVTPIPWRPVQVPEQPVPAPTATMLNSFLPPVLYPGFAPKAQILSVTSN